MDFAIALTSYERDNLIAVLEAIAHLEGPQQAFNTGDWNMQVLFKLGYAGPHGITHWGTPNRTAEQMAADCRSRRCLQCELPQDRLL